MRLLRKAAPLGALGDPSTRNVRRTRTGPSHPGRTSPEQERVPTHPTHAGPRGGKQEATEMIGEDVIAASSETDQLRQQLLQAQKLSSVGTLASSVAHEFNNILTTLINYARLALRAGESEAARTQALEKILKGSQRAATVINSMLGFARNTSTLRARTDLVALVEETLVLTDKDLSKHRIQVEKKYQGRPHADVVPAQIEQVLLNLIINARQAMPRGGRLVLGVRENVRTRMVEVRVADTGVGIAPDRLRLIFEPFYTTKEPDAIGHGGTGLGLSVCRQIIEQHNGRIRVESLVGKGSTFTVKLPMTVAGEKG